VKKVVSVLLRAGAVILFAGYLGAVAWHGLGVPPMVDDPEWVIKADLGPWQLLTPEERLREWRWTTTVPALYRWYTAPIVRLAGADLDAEPPTVGFEGYTPPATRDLLRMASIVLFTATLVILFAIAWRILGNWGLAALAIVPIAASATFWDCVAWRMGPDMLFCLVLAATLAAWVGLDTRGWRGFVIVSLLCGLATSAKQNGILVLGGWCGYLAFTEGPSRRVWRPVVAAALAFAAFAIVDPALWYRGPQEFLSQSIHTRALWSERTVNVFGPCTPWMFFTTAVKAWWALPVFAWFVWRCRREAWFAPVAWWAAALAIGTYVAIPCPETRYLAPLEMGFYFPLMLCIMWLVTRRRADIRASRCR